MSDEKPKFLTVDPNEEVEQADEEMELAELAKPWEPTRRLSARQRELCRLIAQGVPNKKAASMLGYNENRVSIIVNSQKGRECIQQYQDKIFDKSMGEQIRELGPYAMDVVEEILTVKDPNIKPNVKADMAKWVVEKVSGRPKQEVEHTGNIVHEFYEKLEHLEKTGQILDITPSKKELGPSEGDNAATERDKLDYFLDFEADDLEK